MPDLRLLCLILGTPSPKVVTCPRVIPGRAGGFGGHGSVGRSAGQQNWAKSHLRAGRSERTCRRIARFLAYWCRVHNRARLVHDDRTDYGQAGFV